MTISADTLAVVRIARYLDSDLASRAISPESYDSDEDYLAAVNALAPNSPMRPGTWKEHHLLPAWFPLVGHGGVFRLARYRWARQWVTTAIAIADRQINVWRPSGCVQGHLGEDGGIRGWGVFGTPMNTQDLEIAVAILNATKEGKEGQCKK